MKNIIVMSCVICISHVIAITDWSIDLRFPIDAKIIQGTLNKSKLIHIYYEVNKNETVIDYSITEDNHSCGPYKIETSENYMFDKHFHILPLNQDNILLIPIAHDSMFEKYPAKMEVVNLSLCQRSGVVLPNKTNPTEFQITRYADSFDIYYKDSSICEDFYCRISYDFQGNQISTTSNKFHTNKSVPLVKPIGSELRSDKHIGLEFTEEKTIFNLIDSQRSTILTEISDTKFSPQISTTNNLISIAYRLNLTNLNLMQFDLEGNLKFETVVNYNYFVRTAKILNAANGRVYLVASECDRDNCDDEKNIYSVKKFGENGSELGAVLLKLPLPGIIEDLSFYEYKESYCLTRAQLSLGVSGAWQFKKLDIVTKCFTDKDLS